MIYISIILTKLIYFVFCLFNEKNNDKPGMFALKLHRRFLEDIAKPPLIIAVTGTNGKTTTCNLIAHILKDNNYKVTSNLEGANFNPGIAKTLLTSVSIFNKTKTDVLVLEYDEINSAYILDLLRPNYLLVVNLFRDTMKRNAYVNYVFNIINKAIPKETTLILNGDDLISSRLKVLNKRIYFGINELPISKKAKPLDIVDIPICPNCYSPLDYSYIHYRHLGKAKCPNCGFTNPKLDYYITKIEKDSFSLKHKQEVTDFPLVSTSIYNIYNTLATITLLKQLSLKNSDIINSLEKQTIVKSRFSFESIDNIEIIAHMVKTQSPGANEVFNYITSLSGKKEIILSLDDYHDQENSSEMISWLYECDFSILNNPLVTNIVIGGLRHLDYLLRLLIAGIPNSKIRTFNDELDAVNSLNLQNTEKVIILYEITNIPLGMKIKDQVIKKIQENHL